MELALFKVTHLIKSIKTTIGCYSKEPAAPSLSRQCAQAGGEHPLLCGSPGQPEAHWLLPEVSIWWWTPRPCQEKERQEGPGWIWRSWRRGGRLRRILSRECDLMLPAVKSFNKNIWSDQKNEYLNFFSLNIYIHTTSYSTHWKGWSLLSHT